jgi:hypothetical protein
MANPQFTEAGSGPVVHGAVAWENVADSELARLAAGFLEPDPEPDLGFAEAAAAVTGTAGGGLVLALDEVIGDGNGEVVFYNEAGLTSLTVRTDDAVVARGTATEHGPSDDHDISGFAFVSFESGLTLYYPEGLDLAVAPAA